MPETIREAALSLARDHGFRVFLTQARSKEPHKGSKGFYDATADPSKLDRMFSIRPDSNIALRCGDGLVVIDIDNKDGECGSDTLREWERAHGELPETVQALTPTGGCHIYYRVDGECRPSVNKALGVDIRGDGSYVMLPPSIHPDTGTAYEWEFHPDDYPVAMADANVLAFIESVRPTQPRRERFNARKSTESGAGRNNTLAKMAQSLQAQSWDDDAIRSAVETYNRMKFREPLPQAEVDKILAGTFRNYPKGHSPEFEAMRAAEEAMKPKRGRPRKFEHNLVGRALIEEHGACLIDGETPAIRLEDGRYAIGWDAFDTVIIDMHDDCTTSNRKEAKAYVQAKAPAVRQSRPTLIAFENGVLDVDTMELRPWGDSDVITNIIPHRWNPDAHDDAVDSTLEKIACGDVGMEMNLAEVIGLCMFRSAKFGYCPILLGTGSNGKSTYIDMVWNVLGDENVSALQPREIGARFQAVQLAGKLANLGDDISSDYIDADSCSIVKKIATGSQLYTDVKGSTGFKFKPYATMVFSANEFPRLGDTTYGMYRRLFPLKFNAVFKREDPDFDPNIGEKLASEGAVEYLCVLGVEGLRRVMAQNSLTPNEASKKVLADIEVDNSTVVQWIVSGGLTADSVIGRAVQEVYSDYKEWCQGNGVSFVGSRKFSGALAARWHVSATGWGHGYRHGKRVTMRVYVPDVPDSSQGIIPGQ